MPSEIVARRGLSSQQPGSEDLDDMICQPTLDSVRSHPLPTWYDPGRAALALMLKIKLRFRKGDEQPKVPFEQTTTVVQRAT